MNTSQRPTAITVICVLGFIGAALSALLIFSPVASAVGSWYPPFLAVACLAGLASMIGMWMMKKWGVLLYTGMFCVAQAVMLAKGLWVPFAVLIPLVVIGIGFANFAKMD